MEIWWNTSYNRWRMEHASVSVLEGLRSSPQERAFLHYFSKSFRTCNPTHSSQHPFESASSLLPLWTEEGGLSKWSHLTKTTPIGEPGLEGQTPALTSGSGMSACIGEGGGTWKDEK